ncbi:MAG: ESX secretion-associated protein EspG [Pseudonocardiaceae bacterium]
MTLAWRLSAAQWDVLTEVLGGQRYPSPIQVRSHGRTRAERVQIRADVCVELAALGLLRAGRVDAELEAALRLLHWPASWVDSVWLADAVADQPVRVVAAQGGVAGVCALQHPDQPGATVLEVIPATGLAAAVVRRLPPWPPGGRATVTVPRQPGEQPVRQPILVPVSATRGSTERDSAAAILDTPVRAGQIAANVRDPSSGRVCRSDVLRWCDNVDGRYQVMLNRRSGDLTVGPADPQRLGEAVRRSLAALGSC